MADEQQEAQGGEAQEKTLLETIIEDGKLARDATDEDQQEHARGLVNEFVKSVLPKQGEDKKDVLSAVKEAIADIDRRLTDQVNAIMHAEDFKELEASWRGLHFLVMNSETGEKLKIRVLDTPRKLLEKDLFRDGDPDQSELFKMVYEEEYGTFGGAPYSCLVADISFGRHPMDMKLLAKLAQVSAAAHAPMLGAADPLLLDLSDWTELMDPRDLAKIFESSESGIVSWRSFRQSEESRYVTLTLPKVLMRLPFHPDYVPVEEFDFKEDVTGATQENFCWGNPAYIMAQRITNAYALYGWTAAIRGVEGGGKVENLPVYNFPTADGDLAIMCPTQISITDRREKELNDLGFISLIYCKGENYAAFFGGQTTNKPQTYFSDFANANARLSSSLPYLLNASRFAHYIKAIMRDKVGSFMTASNVSTFLNDWITNYVLLDDDAPQEIKAQYPLREARVDVTEIPGQPGCYNATVFLKPHFQLEELTASIRLVAELPPPAA